MAAAFLDLAHGCAPMVQAELLASVVSLESRFKPFAIRITSGSPLSAQPSSKAEAIEVATSLIAASKDVQIGLGGLGVEELPKLGLSLSDAFDPCLNLKATAMLLDGYYRLALRVGADPGRAETVMLQSYYGRFDPSVGAMANYGEQIFREKKRLSEELASVTIADPGGQPVPAEKPRYQAWQLSSGEVPQIEQAASWDVFSSRRRSSVLVFQHNSSETSE